MWKSSKPIWRRFILPRWVFLSSLCLFVLFIGFAANHGTGTVGEKNIFWILILLIFPSYFAVKSIDKIWRDRAFNRAISRPEITFPKSERLILYLRSFSESSDYAWNERIRELKMVAFRDHLDRLGLSFLNFDPRLNQTAVVPEQELYEVLGGNFTFVAIGDKYWTFGARKLYASDTEWQSKFAWCCDRAEAVFCQIGSSRSSLWEVQEIIRNDKLAAKTFLILPPRASRFKFEMLQYAIQSTGFKLPPFSKIGWACGSHSTNLCIDYKRFRRELKRFRPRVDGDLSSFFMNAMISTTSTGSPRKDACH